MRRLVIGFVLASTLALSGCSTTSAISSLTSNPLVSSLTGGIPGLSAEQAIGGAGALLGLAKEKIPADQWGKIASAVPGSSDLVTQGLKLAGLSGGSLGSLANMAGGLGKLGVTPDTVSKMVPAMGSFIGKSGGSDLANTFLNAVK